LRTPVSPNTHLVKWLTYFLLAPLLLAYNSLLKRSNDPEMITLALFLPYVAETKITDLPEAP